MNKTLEIGQWLNLMIHGAYVFKKFFSKEDRVSLFFFSLTKDILIPNIIGEQYLANNFGLKTW